MIPRLAVHLEGLRTHKAALPLELRDVVGLPVGFFGSPGISLHLVGDPSYDVFPVDSLYRGMDTADVGTLDCVHHIGAVDEHLGRDATPG